jgi:hypothetical protein
VKILYAFGAGLALIQAGCATRSSDIQAAYVSPVQYQSFSCQQLREEAASVSASLLSFSGQRLS